MSHRLEERDRRKVESVSRSGFECPDTSFAKDDFFVAAGHDVFCAHQEFLQCVCQASLEEYRLVELADFFQELEVLHVSRTDLDDVDVFKKRQL